MLAITSSILAIAYTSNLLSLLIYDLIEWWPTEAISYELSLTGAVAFNSAVSSNCWNLSTHYIYKYILH